MTKLGAAQQHMQQQGAELADNLDRAAREVTDSVVRMSEEIRQFIERKRAESRRPSRNNLPAVKP
jgi:hypothetical protein